MTQDVDFSALTKAQRRILGWIATGGDTGHHPKVLAALEKKGLIVGEDESLPGWPPVTVRRHHVPLPIHMQWCAWCAEHCPIPAGNDGDDDGL